MTTAFRGVLPSLLPDRRLFHRQLWQKKEHHATLPALAEQQNKEAPNPKPKGMRTVACTIKGSKPQHKQRDVLMCPGSPNEVLSRISFLEQFVTSSMNFIKKSVATEKTSVGNGYQCIIMLPNLNCPFAKAEPISTYNCIASAEAF